MAADHSGNHWPDSGKNIDELARYVIQAADKIFRFPEESAGPATSGADPIRRALP
jgi:hypothetical protein